MATSDPGNGNTPHFDNSVGKVMSSDSSIVDEVRKRRHEISARYGHDLIAYARHLKEIEEQHRDRVVSQVTVVAPRPRSQADSK